MLSLSVKADIREAEAFLTSIQRQQLPFATARALTYTAKFVQAKLEQEIGRSIDRPKQITLKSLYVTPATKQRLYAEVKIKDDLGRGTPPIKWLSANVHGGPRSFKKLEGLLRSRGILPGGMYAMPGRGADLDANGNMSRAQISRILRLVNSGMRTKRGKAPKEVYFSLQVRRGRLPPGIYQRVGYGDYFGKGAGRQGTGGGSKVVPMMIFVNRATYRKRFRFFEVADQTARLRFPIEFALAMRVALRTAR